MDHNNIMAQAELLLRSNDPEAKFRASQLALNLLPPSYFVESYLDDNEGRQQNLDAFPMMRTIYNTAPQKLLLKCSRKTLKSTLLSNTICLNLTRWNKYKMMYVGPQELTVKYFSSNYVAPRFSSERVKRLLVKDWDKDDVFEKILGDTGSSCLFRFCKDDATRIRGPAVDHMVYDEIQDISFDQLPIIKECMALSPYKREIFAGTPLTTDNTINVLWQASNQLEWAFKCEGCNHWNTLTIDNEPLKMISEHGIVCSKCTRKIDTRKGEWVSIQPKNKDLIGYHLAQPILPFFNESPKEWNEFYKKVTDGKYSIAQIYNEAFGIAFDIGTKPITLEELKKICVLGPMKGEGDRMEIFHNNRHRYVAYAVGADWGVNGTKSRTSSCALAMREDGLIDCIFGRIYTDFDYEGQVRSIARLANDLFAKGASDSGPAPDRGIRLAELTAPDRFCLVRYEHGKLIQRYDRPAGAYSWKQSRWCLHRSDTLNMVFKYLKSGKLRFPQYEDVSDLMQDILNEFIEIKEGDYRQEIMYRHAPDKPDDFLHALNFGLCSLLSMVSDTTLEGPSSSSAEYF
jgi:hypothetical protein